MDKVCFDKTFLILVIVTITGLAVYHCLTFDGRVSECAPCNNSVNVQPPVQPQVSIVPPTEPPAHPLQVANELITDYDYRNLYDPLTEPGKRPPRYIIAPMVGNPNFNIPTRGYADNYSLQGYLVDETSTKMNDNNKFLRLYGRQKYPGSSEYEYYVEINNGSVMNDKIKYELRRQRRELFDDDEVYVDVLKRNYKVRLNRQRDMEYNPFLY